MTAVIDTAVALQRREPSISSAREDESQKKFTGRDPIGRFEASIVVDAMIRRPLTLDDLLDRRA
jgi:hypothetical protein